MSTRQFRILTVLTVLAGFLGGGVAVLVLQGERAHAQTETYELYALRTAIRDLKSDIEGLKSEIRHDVYGPLGTPVLGTGGLKGDIDDLKSDIEGLKRATEWDIGGLKSDVEGLKSDIDDLKSNIDDLKSDIGDLRTAVLVLYRSVSTRGASARTSRRSSAKGFRAGVSHAEHRKH